ncbi:TMEM164 family acyltransferase [Haploplasma axanthum]|uniref:Integral membrane protein (Intg_mem_TP0381) n=1 Tax=Haploplasma axanthum TaxID=29552 RepID=A0A449BE75_HAPAX|nr:hypothetical protein [Haploplasma axanthum]VEU80728.1 Integral membrane protein (intg_mem_TP0381) [Haploplasma axanthum]
METLKFYLLYVPLGVIATILLVKYLKNKTNEQRYRFLIYLSIAALLLHLIKPFFFPYNTEVYSENGILIISKPSIYRKMTFENICAVSALVYLPLLLLKKKIPLDYIATIGLIGGFAAFMYPTEVILGMFDSMKVTYKLGLFSFDTMRFYIVHYLIFIIPFLLLYYKLHTFELKRAIFLPISILVMLTMVYVNELILDKFGWLDAVHEYAGRDIFLDSNIRNSSFVFGISDGFKKIGIIIDMLVPKFMKEPYYIPVLWITIPAFVYGPLLYFGFEYATDRKKAVLELKTLFKKSENTK